MIDPSIFKAYDIRGVYPEEINEPAVRRIAQAYARHLEDQKSGAKDLGKTLLIGVGRDVRLSSPSLQKAVIDGLIEAGARVVDIGAVPTEMLYFAVGYYHLDGGIQVSASHNPVEFNGLKLVAGGVEAISSETGLNEIKTLALSGDDLSSSAKGEVRKKEIEIDYLDFLTKFAEFEDIGPKKIVLNGNFGLNAQIAKKLISRLAVSQIELLELNCEPDGSFPKGRPDPLIESNRAETSDLTRRSGADLAVAWDADGDRCYVADENGDFIEGCHFTALLARYLLQIYPGEKIIYDPRNVWAVEETVKTAGGVALVNKAGHTFIKNRMKQENALFAGEMSGHFYFRDFFYADNGLIPFLLLLNILKDQPDKKLSEIIKPFRERYFVSGEINFKVADKQIVLDKLEKRYSSGRIDRTDGLSVAFLDWRFNVRASNTENLLRLNVEAKVDKVCQEKTDELVKLIGVE